MKQILLKPIITEKSMNGVASGKYVFQVNPNVNKIEILKAVKDIYKVEPIKVNLINIKSITKMFQGKHPGRTKSWKKAIITLKKGQKINEFNVKV